MLYIFLILFFLSVLILLLSCIFDAGWLTKTAFWVCVFSFFVVGTCVFILEQYRYWESEPSDKWEQIEDIELQVISEVNTESPVFVMDLGDEDPSFCSVFVWDCQSGKYLH